jgi:hypothetical protein
VTLTPGFSQLLTPPLLCNAQLLFVLPLALFLSLTRHATPFLAGTTFAYPSQLEVDVLFSAGCAVSHLLQGYHNVVAAPKEEADEEEVTPFMSFGD